MSRLLRAERTQLGISQQDIADRLRRPQSFVSKYERDERRLDVLELLEVLEVLGCEPEAFLRRLTGSDNTILDRWELSAQELTAIVDENPSLRGMLLGYVAEAKLASLLESHEHVTASHKDDDHDRRRKGDRVITYLNDQYIIELKSLQTNSVRETSFGWSGKVQVDASDRRPVEFPDGSQLATTCLLAGQFDLLAVNLFAFGDEWRFIFAKNRDLPRSTFRGYSEYQRRHLLATMVSVTWPPEPPFYSEPWGLLREIGEER
ncbi:MAG: helix-turn-helix transcriptional regulator [Acidobacteria bacterium]|nr:helix-turn-helix transcriptional regulator [Acidobacteriota bacterium]